MKWRISYKSNSYHKNMWEKKSFFFLLQGFFSFVFCQEYCFVWSGGMVKCSLWSMARKRLAGADWTVTHCMACATVTSFGLSSAGKAEAVCQCSLPASHSTVNRDYDHIMQMTVPSVHSSFVLACALSLCSDAYLSPQGYRESDCAAMCWQGWRW